MNAVNGKYIATSLVLVGIVAFAYRTSVIDIQKRSPGAIAWKSFDEGTILAKQSNKKILVDVYTDWCSWCKKMDSEVYTDEKVVRLLDEQFVPVKLNAESGKAVSFQGNTLTETEFARQLGVSGYPTTLFFDQDAKPITALPGYVVPDRFQAVLDFIGKDYYKTISFQQYLSRQSSAR